MEIKQPKISSEFAIVVIVLLTSALGVSVWMMGNLTTSQPIVQNTETEQKAQEKPVAENADKVVYENKELGFFLELPESWKGYNVEVEKTQEVLPLQGGFITLFSADSEKFKNKNGNEIIGDYVNDYPIASIKWTKKANWDVVEQHCNLSKDAEFLAICKSNHNLVLGENNAYVFSILPLDNQNKKLLNWGATAEDGNKAYIEYFKAHFRELK